MARIETEAVLTAGLGILTAGISNYARGNAIISRLPRYALYGAIGYGIGHLMAQRIKRGVAEREIIIFDYIKNHPEDFPEYQPRLYKDVLEPWYPIR